MSKDFLEKVIKQATEEKLSQIFTDFSDLIYGTA
jgi:hypothetical protein